MVKSKVLIRTISVAVTAVMLISCGSTAVINLPATPEEKLSVILSLDPGNTLRYFVNGSDSVNEGILQEVTEDSLCIWINDSEIRVGPNAIDSLWIQERSVRSGIKTGAIIGWSAVTGYAVLSILYIDETDDKDYANLLLAPLIGVVGGIGGGGIGACFGAGILRWERLI